MRIGAGAVRAVLLACLLAVPGLILFACPADAATPSPVRHVVVVGLSGLRWSDVSPSATPTLWRLAGHGPAGSLGGYARLPLPRPAGGRPTLNPRARAHAQHPPPARGAVPPRDPTRARAPGPPPAPPHLQLALVAGPGSRAGLLDAASTRQPGLVVLTDLTPTVLGWLGRAPPDTVGARITRGDRGGLAQTVRSLTGRDTAEQVWRGTPHEVFLAPPLAAPPVLAPLRPACCGSAA